MCACGVTWPTGDDAIEQPQGCLWGAELETPQTHTEMSVAGPQRPSKFESDQMDLT
jgi:hypothetical protein